MRGKVTVFIFFLFYFFFFPSFFCFQVLFCYFVFARVSFITSTTHIRTTVRLRSVSARANLHSPQGIIFYFSFPSLFSQVYASIHSLIHCFIIFLQVPPHHADDDRIDTIRQRIRQLHRQNGRGYTLPNGRFFPIAPQVVRPLVDYAENVVEWWRTNAGDENVQNTQAA